MIIKFPLGYTVTGIKKRQQKETTENFFEWIDIEIAEFDDIEAPVAARWFDKTPQELVDHKSRGNWGRTPDDGICETRWFNNNHWWPTLGEEKNHNDKIFYGDRITPEILSKKLKSNNLIKELFSFKNTVIHSQLYDDVDNKGNPFNPDNYRSVASSTRQQNLKLLEDSICDIMIVKDQVWHRGKQPIIHIEYSLINGDDLIGLLKIIPEDSPKKVNLNHTFSLTQYEEALEQAVEYAKEDIDNFNRRTNLTLFLSESLNNNLEEEILITTINNYIDKFHDHFSKSYHPWFELPSEILIDFIEFKNDLKNYNLDKNIDILENATNNYLNKIKDFEPLENLSRDLINATRRLKAKPIDLNF